MSRAEVDRPLKSMHVSLLAIARGEDMMDRVEEQVLDHLLHAMSRRGDAVPVLVDAVDDPGEVEA